MRLLFIRHGDPDYKIDGLTEKGKIEAQCLAKHIQDFGIDDVYVSPCGRAQRTAEYSLEVLGKEATTLKWLEEFPALFDPNIADEETKKAYPNELFKKKDSDEYHKRIVWDVMPSYYKAHPEILDVHTYMDSDIVKYTDMPEVYERVISGFNQLLSDYGYERDGNVFKVRESNDKTIAFFCHFGLTSVLLSYLWGVSPFVPMQFLAMAPTSVTEIVTEEREKGIAIFRTLRVGDITHLKLENEKPSFSARFCERFENEDERH
jgi:probable phosphoglycerate mutase